VAHEDIFPLYAAREPFFVKMWPAYETEFETPAIECLVLFEWMAPYSFFYRARMMKMADKHILESMDYVVGSDYVGSHWLATFLTHAIQKREEAVKVLSRN